MKKIILSILVAAFIVSIVGNCLADASTGCTKSTKKPTSKQPVNGG